VTNKARVEASIVEATLIKEISTYYSSYFVERSNSRRPEVDKNNPSQGKLSIFETHGRSLGRGNRRTLDSREFLVAHNFILFNCPEIKPYLEYILYKLIFIILFMICIQTNIQIIR
jgi:hypothetical protein